MSFELPELDRKKTQAAVEAVLEKYRICKSITFEDREASTTQAYSDMPPSSPTNVTSDQTASIAIHNADASAERRAYCKRMEQVVNKLPRRERFLITERYLNCDCDFDYVVYSQVFDPPISEFTYYKLKWKAFYKIALNLNIQVVKEDQKELGNITGEHKE